MGGYETLKNYAGKLKIDFTVAKDPLGLNAFIAGSRSDVVIIDTFAVNHNNVYRLNALAKFFEGLKGSVNIELAVPAHFKHIDALRSYESFRNKIGVNGIIITKTDESKGIGNLAGLFMLEDSAVDYVSYGENVPEDIEEANAGNIYPLFFPKPASF